MKKNLTGFLRFARTPLGSSGGSGPLDPPPASYAAESLSMTVCLPSVYVYLTVTIHYITQLTIRYSVHDTHRQIFTLNDF